MAGRGTATHPVRWTHSFQPTGQPEGQQGLWWRCTGCGLEHNGGYGHRLPPELDECINPFEKSNQGGR